MKLSLKRFLKEVGEPAQPQPTTQQPQHKGKIFVLVGPPSVGKSTWIDNTFKGQNPYIISRDDIAESVASKYGWSYDDMFVPPPPGSKKGDVDNKYGTVVPSPAWMKWQPLSFDKVLQANNEVQQLFQSRVASAANNPLIVIDMTNMNAGSRAQALAAIKGAEQNYEKIAVVFEFEGAEQFIKKVAQNRAAAAKRMGKSKTIPDAALDRMFQAFSRPTAQEGFDRIESVDNREVLRNLAQQAVNESRLLKIAKII